MQKDRKRRSRKEWAALVESADNSKLPVREFCTKHNISSAGLYKWRSRLKSKSVFVPVKVTSGEACGAKASALPEISPVILNEEASPIILPAPPATKSQSSTKMIPTDILPELQPETSASPLLQITSRFILHSGSIKIEFPGGCTSTELQFVAGALSC